MDRIAHLEARLERAERRARWTFGAGLTALVAALIGAAAAPAISQENGSTVKGPFKVLAADNKPMLEVNSDKDGPYMKLFDAEGRTAVWLWADKAGGNLIIRNPAGKNTAALTSRDDGAGGEVTAYTKDGTTAAAMFAREDGAGGNLRVNDAKGTAVGALFARTDGAGGNMAVYDKNGKSVVALLARPDGAGGDVAVYHSTGQIVSALFSAGDTGNLVIRDKGGNDLFFKP
jgi:hypothetical protein